MTLILFLVVFIISPQEDFYLTPYLEEVIRERNEKEEWMKK